MKIPEINYQVLELLRYCESLKVEAATIRVAPLEPLEIALLFWPCRHWLLGCGPRRLDFLPTKRAENVAWMDRVMTMWTLRTQALAAMRAIGVAGLHMRTTSRAETRQCLPEDEVQDNSQAVWDKHRQQRPSQTAHSASAGILVDVPNQQEIAP